MIGGISVPWWGQPSTSPQSAAPSSTVDTDTPPDGDSSGIVVPSLWGSSASGGRQFAPPTGDASDSDDSCKDGGMHHPRGLRREQEEEVASARQTDDFAGRFPRTARVPAAGIGAYDQAQQQHRGVEGLAPAVRDTTPAVNPVVVHPSSTSRAALLGPATSSQVGAASGMLAAFQHQHHPSAGLLARRTAGGAPPAGAFFHHPLGGQSYPHPSPSIPATAFQLVPAVASSTKLGDGQQQLPRGPEAPTTTPPIEKHSLVPYHRRRPRHVGIVGRNGVGKSSLINAFRAVTASGRRWQAATVGVTGHTGTASNRAYFNAPTMQTASWVLIDTPGRVYERLYRDADVTSHDERIIDETNVDAQILRRLRSGIGELRLLGGQAAHALRDAEDVPENRCEQFILLLRADDIIRRTPVVQRVIRRFTGRTTADFGPTPDQALLVECVADVVQLLRQLLDDRSPFVVVTHMDTIGGNTPQARQALWGALRKCVSLNRLFFVQLPLASFDSFSGFAETPVEPLRELAPSSSTDVGRRSPAIFERPGGADHPRTAAVAHHILDTGGVDVSDPQSREQLVLLHEALTADIESARLREGSALPQHAHARAKSPA